VVEIGIRYLLHCNLSRRTANFGGLDDEFRANRPNNPAANCADAENWHEHLSNNRRRQTEQNSYGETD
jgi:hypothetical protein